MGKAQSVDTILSAARLIKNNDSKVKIIILGSGIEAERLSKKSKKNGSAQCDFYPFSSYDRGWNIFKGC